MDAEKRYKEWMNRLSETDPLREELAEIKGDEKEITDRFYRDIEFGTAGLRGICGAGTNRMNRLTVGRATQGIANYILSTKKDPERGVVIAYDCRHFSREFSEQAAEILAGNGIRVYLFPSLRPTPELSFALRKLGCISGINMTASHNPREYNGYKVYWEDGAQISGAVSDGMQTEIEKLDYFDAPQRMAMEQAQASGKIVMLSADMDRAYLDYVESLSQHSGSELNLDISAVYTPLNGAGSVPFMQMAEERGFRNLHIVKEQKNPDPDFTTVPFPNPENPENFAYAEKLGQKEEAELLIATDPDSDRMAVEIRMEDGSYRFLNGNQTGALLIYYLASSRKEKGTLTGKQAMIKSIVTGDFGRKICEDYGIHVFETLTGFKNICGKIPEVEKEGFQYFFGYEESIGCAPGEAVRDKDGICAGMLVLEMAAYYSARGMHMRDVLHALYEKYGYFKEDQVSIVEKGMEGAAKIQKIMDTFRNLSDDELTKRGIRIRIDYKNGWKDIPPQNAMKFIRTDGSWFAVRPSGTEPKLKLYFYSEDVSEKAAEEKLRSMKQMVLPL
ncbi:MAG: phospho-sugar mutase [Eubacterium sp.]|nr:phospho-sugar mutase [Eubacterium sp.]